MRKYLHEARILIALVIPVIFAQGSQTAIGVVDTMMAGGVSPTDLAAVAIGTSIWLPTILFGNGLLLALTPIVAQFNGSGRRDRIAHQVQQSYWLAATLSLLAMAFLYNCQYILEMISDDPELVRISVGYLHTILWGAPGYLFFQVLRNQCEGLSKTKPGMIIGFIALMINVPINYIFIYGKFGMPALGGIGCGIASAIVYWSMYFMIRYYVKSASSQRDVNKMAKFEWPHGPTLKRLVGLGLPVALALFFEVSLFAVVALLITPLGPIQVSAHQITLSFSGLMFVLPMSMGIAAAIRVGHLLGEKKVDQAKIASYSALAIGVSVAVVTANLSIVFREHIALLYNNNPQVILLAAHLMFLAAAYQCSDAVQVIGAGILRGYKDTRSIFFITLISYWVLGLPSGYLLGLTDYLVPAMGPAGFWIGFIIGLSCAAVLVGFRIRHIQRLPHQVTLKRAGH
jgi:MATE family multidrug resistance protein